MQRFVKARVTIAGIHHWPDAPEQYRPLRDQHRHLFTFEAEVEVGESRQVEFLDAANEVRRALEANFHLSPYWGCLDFGAYSCEQLAAFVYERFHCRRVTVWEDMENAGGVERDA